MSKLENYCEKLTDEDWEKLAIEIDEALKNPENPDFYNKYGFTAKSIRPYKIQHFIELEKRNKMLNEQRAELARENGVEKLQDQINALTSFPAIRAMNGTSAKATFYATEEALNQFNRAIDEVVKRYGFKRYLAAAFLLEEGLKRMGLS